MTSMYSRIWRECLVLPHVKLTAMLTTYIKATIWRVISFSSFESIPLHPWGATMESVPHMSEEVGCITLKCASTSSRVHPRQHPGRTPLVRPVCHGCSPVGDSGTRFGAPTGVHPWELMVLISVIEYVRIEVTHMLMCVTNFLVVDVSMVASHWWTPMGESGTSMEAPTGVHPWQFMICILVLPTYVWL